MKPRKCYNGKRDTHKFPVQCSGCVGYSLGRKNSKCREDGK